MGVFFLVGVAEGGGRGGEGVKIKRQIHITYATAECSSGRSWILNFTSVCFLI